MQIAIIGGGASGVAAALSASENEDNKIVIFEEKSRCLKKLLATGNGRCNLSNSNVSISNYFGDAEPAMNIINKFNSTKTIEWFKNMGLLTVTEPDGRVYPYTNRANTVLDILRYELEKHKNIEIRNDSIVQKIEKTNNCFELTVNGDICEFDRIVLCTGSCAGGVLGSENSYINLQDIGHKLLKPYPSICRIKTAGNFCKGLKGIRCEAGLKLKYRDRILKESTGEIQFTEDGISGPVAFEISSSNARRGKSCSCVLDLAPYFTISELTDYFTDIKKRNASAAIEVLFYGLLHPRLASAFISYISIKRMILGDLSKIDIEEIVSCLKNIELKTSDPVPFNECQVVSGGFSLKDFNCDTLESNYLPGLFAAGEVLNVDGECGGYNLQWAWSSGYIAGFNAGR